MLLIIPILVYKFCPIIVVETLLFSFTISAIVQEFLSYGHFGRIERALLKYVSSVMLDEFMAGHDVVIRMSLHRLCFSKFITGLYRNLFCTSEMGICYGIFDIVSFNNETWVEKKHVEHRANVNSSQIHKTRHGISKATTAESVIVECTVKRTRNIILCK